MGERQIPNTPEGLTLGVERYMRAIGAAALASDVGAAAAAASDLVRVIASASYLAGASRGPEDAADISEDYGRKVADVVALAAMNTAPEPTSLSREQSP